MIVNGIEQIEEVGKAEFNPNYATVAYNVRRERTEFINKTHLRVYTTITRSIDFLYKLSSLLAALSRKKSWFAYKNLV